MCSRLNMIGRWIRAAFGALDSPDAVRSASPTSSRMRLEAATKIGRYRSA